MGLGKWPLGRRAALTTLGSVLAIMASAPRVLPRTAAAPAPRPACTFTSAAIPGPFYFDPKLQRGDVTEGHPGRHCDCASS